jgi:3-phenylpropionate/cinnamic acid dioxygenase small subunit
MALSPQELSDRTEIHDTLIRYAQAIDTKEFGLLADVFTPDAQVDYTTSGGIAGKYPEIRAWLEKALTPFPSYLHALSNTTYRFDGDSAYTRTYFVNPMAYPADGGLHTFTVYGFYVDRLVRTADGWRIAERKEEQALMEGTLPPNFEIPT